ncbi:sensor histidine kinase [Roseateles cellulosilyticus]|uniref:Sensor histidine kinase n=1 Tax=Pelomonas cellulosilytica TaxID=2906762 RepID=A0ABS8XRE3_9BURK|nr:sensor histidine kinase [Pelomonas sp. P8]MCE4553855.1 sensor histidine kinase [Pelomonas sp. P8]
MLLLCAASAASADDAFSTHFTQADHQVQPVDQAGHARAPQDGPWQSISLPDQLRRPVDDGADGQAPRAMHWYRLRWTVPAGLAADAPLVVYAPRAIGWPVQLWLLGPSGWQQVFDNQASGAEQWNRPLLMRLPPGRRVPGEVLTLAVGQPSRVGGFYALSTLWVGPEDELRNRYGVRSALQQTVPAAITLAMLGMGLLSFVVWLGRRAERAYLYFALAAACWALRNLHLFINLPGNETAFLWFWWMTGASVSWVMLATYLFAFRFDARRLPRLERALACFVVGGSVLTLPQLLPLPLLVQQGINLVVAVTVTAALTVLAVRGGRRELRVIVAALWLGLALAAHDLLLVGVLIGPESIYLMPYGALLMICSFLYAALRRFTGAVEQAESASLVLAARLAEREAELAARHEQLRAVEREQALLRERQRLMRDMHDGVGSHLIALLRLAESGVDGSVMAELLRSAIEDLRLTIDSLEPLEHDLATLLATLRTRVGHRLEMAGLRLEWAMADMPPLPWLEPAQALQVLRLIQEAMTNVIKHAGARTLSLSARQAGAVLEVCVADDGCGFDVSQPARGQGLASMRQRARALGAGLDIEASPGRGSRITLRLPLRP